MTEDGRSVKRNAGRRREIKIENVKCKVMVSLRDGILIFRQEWERVLSYADIVKNPKS